jgi:hypothetical protein
MLCEIYMNIKNSCKTLHKNQNFTVLDRDFCFFLQVSIFILAKTNIH